MKYVSFYSEVAATNLRRPHRMISITEGDHRAKFPIEHTDLLRLSFHDVDDDFNGQYTMFSLVDARKILDFAGKVEDGEVLIVHCQAGISRSASVAKFLTQHKGFALLLDRYCNGKMDLYNSRVYGTLRMVDMDNVRLLAASEEEVERYGKQPKW